MMIAFGFALLVIAAALGVTGVWASLATDDKISFNFMSNVLEVHPLVMFCVGAGSVALLLWGLQITGWGAVRKVRTMQERRDLERQHEEQQRELARTQRELAARKDADDLEKELKQARTDAVGDSKPSASSAAKDKGTEK